MERTCLKTGNESITIVSNLSEKFWLNDQINLLRNELAMKDIVIIKMNELYQKNQQALKDLDSAIERVNKIHDETKKKPKTKKCSHDKQYQYCKQCNGSALCKSSHCETMGIKKYNGYCLSCCIEVCPDIEVLRNYKTKEKDVVARITNHFKDYSWITDKKIADGCSKRRPDLFLDLKSHIIIVEVDEHKHSSYDSSSENRRVVELSKDVGDRPIVFIRFNPDTYRDNNGNKVKGCWKLDKQGMLFIADLKDWNHRIQTLTENIKYWIHNPSSKSVEVIQLFY
jgi:hypothetical protein